MLNPFYWYACIWSIVICLYELHLSGINEELTDYLFFFLFITSVISVVIGFILRNIFRYQKINKIPKIKWKWTFLILLVSIVEFIYSKQIPLFSIALKGSVYGDFTGIPFIHTLFTNFNILYSSYLFYLYLELYDKKILNMVVIQVLMFILMFQKSAAIICLFIFVNVGIAKLRSENHFFNSKNISLIIIVIIILLYLNGCLANIRNGVNWNDNSYVMTLTRIEKWPSFVPGQFAWAYTYLTTPLGNLNRLLGVFNGYIDFPKVIGTVIPITILKVFFPNWMVSTNLLNLIVSAMNACTGFQDPQGAGGIVGMYIFFVLTTIIVLVISLYIQRKCVIQSPLYAILSMMIAFCFFYDTFNTAATAFLPLMIMIFSKIHAKKI